MSDPIWTQDVSVLFKLERLMEFFPIKSQTNEERVNAIVRLSLYISIVLGFYNSNIKFIAIFLFFLGFTFIIYRHHPELKFKDEKSLSIQEKVQKEVEEEAVNEQFRPKLNGFTPSLGLSGVRENLEVEISDNSKCTKPTLDNPFMNVTMKDYMNFDEKGFIVNRPPACDTNSPEIKKLMDDTFSNNLYKDVSDVFGKIGSQRNYFTMPWTTIPNKQDEYARWLYLSPKTCKEDQDNCLGYEDIRAKRFVMPNPDRNPISSKKENLPV